MESFQEYVKRRNTERRAEDAVESNKSVVTASDRGSAQRSGRVETFDEYLARRAQESPQDRPFTDIRTAARSVSNERLVRRAEQDRAYQIALDNLQREQRKHAEETYKATPMYQRAALYQRYLETPEGKESQYSVEDFDNAIKEVESKKAADEENRRNLNTEKNTLWQRISGYRRGGLPVPQDIQDRYDEIDAALRETSSYDEEIGRLQAGKKRREWNDLRNNEDFAEKAVYNPNLYNDYEHQRQSLGDDPYEYINANPEVRERIKANQSYGIREDNGWSQYDSRDWSGYDDLPQDVKDTYNYIYNTRGKNEANEYLSSAAPLKATFSESLLAGITAPLANALSIFDDDIAHSAALENARVASGDYSWAYKAGSTASNIASMLLMGKGFSAVGKALGVSSNLASGAVYNALTMGSQSALSQAPYLRTGQITPEDFGRSIGANAIAGAAASISSGLISTGINKVLVQKGLQTKFNNYLTNAASSSAYAATNTLTQNALSKKKMTDEELAWSLVEGFAYSLISSAVRTGIQNRQTAQYVERLQKELNDGWEEITRTASQSTGGDNSRTQAIARELLAKAQEGRAYIEQMSMPGQQSAKNDILAGYDLLISNFNAAANGLPQSTQGLPQSTQVPAAPSNVVSGIQNALQAGINNVPNDSGAVNGIAPPIQDMPRTTEVADKDHIINKITSNIPSLSNDKPVADVKGTEFSKGTKKLTEQVSDFFKSIGNKVHRKGFGDITLDSRSARDDIAHGIGRAKAATFAAVPSVIEQGRQIDFQENWKGRGRDSYVFAAPITLEGEKSYVAAVVLKGGDNRFYLHEVVDGKGNIIYKKNGISDNLKTANENTTLNVAGVTEAPLSNANIAPIKGNSNIKNEISSAPGAGNISKADLDRISGEYDGSTDEIVYSRGMVEGYNYGLNGYPKDQITADGFYNDLTPAQREYSYALGQNAAAKNKVTSADTEKKLKELGVGEEGITAFKDGYTVGTDFDTYYKDFTDGYKTGTVDNILELSGEGAKQAVVDGFSARLRDEESGSLPVAAPEARRADVSLETGKSSYTDIQSQIEALEDAQARTNDPAEIDRIEKEIEELQSSAVKETAVEKYNSLTYDGLSKKKAVSPVSIRIFDKASSTRKGVIAEGLKNAASVGRKISETQAAVYVDDINAEIIVTNRSLYHGLDRRISLNAGITEKIGEILKNSIRINESNPEKSSVKNSYVLAAVVKDKEPAVVISFVDMKSRELGDVYVLHSTNIKEKESAAHAPELSELPILNTDSKISIENLLRFVNHFSPEVLPEDVLRRFGYPDRPPGKYGERMLFEKNALERIVAGHQITLDEYARSINSQKAKTERGQIVKAVTDAQKQAQLIDKNGTRTIALGIVDNFVEKGAVDYENVRLDAKNPEIAASQVAAYGMLLRDPRFETFRILFTKGDRIISVQSFTSRLVDRAYITKGMMDSIIARRNDLKASGYYLMHNHPSGDPSESGADIAMTRRFSQMVPGFKGHIIVDHNKYSYLNASGYSQGGIQTIAGGKAETFEKRIVDHPLLYDVFNDPDKLAQAAVDLVHSKDVGVLMYCDTKGKLRAIEEVKNTFMKSTDAFEQYLADRKTQLGSSRTFLLMTGGIAWDDAAYDLQHLFLRNLIFDIIDRGGRSMYKGDSGLTVNIGGRIENINGTVRDRMDYNPDGTVGEKAFEVKEVNDRDTLRFLDNQPKEKVYRAMQVIDGKLYPPMAAKIDGKLVEPSEIGKWYQAEERPELIRKGNKFKLDKANGSAIEAAYNPYFHTSRSPLNDQFSSAYKRDNLVVVEGEVPSSELTSGYKAEYAKDAVGEVTWHSGPVSSKLKGDKQRKVILSRWFKPVRIVPDSEVAQRVSELLKGEDITIPSNTVTPSLRAELEKLNVPVVDDALNNTNALFEEQAGYGAADAKEYPFLRDDTKDEVHKVATDIKYGSEVRLTDHSPSIITSQKNTKDLPLVMRASHVRENILSEAEAKKLGLSTKGKHFHSLGEELYLQVINGLNDVDLAYRGTKNAPKPERRENYFLLVSKIKDQNGNTINIPVFVNEHAQYNTVYIDVNRVATVFGNDNLENAIREQVRKGWLVRVKNKSIKASESPVPLTGNYGNNASMDKIPQIREESNPYLKDSAGRTLSPEQRDYFKNSKVRDNKGNLLVMYHGTPAGGFTVFRNGLAFFSQNKEYADRFQIPSASSRQAGKEATSPKTYEVYLNITKPFDIREPSTRKLFINEYVKGGYALGINPYTEYYDTTSSGLPSWEEADNIYEFLEDKGLLERYDGIIVDEGGDLDGNGNTKHRGISYVTFNPEQIKATDNTTPSEDPDILREEGNGYGTRISEKDNPYFIESEKTVPEELASTRKELNKALRELKGAREKADYWKGQTRLTKFEKLTDRSVKALANQYAENTELNRKELAAEIKDLGEWAINQPEGFSLGAFRDRVRKLAVKLGEAELPVYEEYWDDSLKEAADFIKASKISVRRSDLPTDFFKKGGEGRKKFNKLHISISEQGDMDSWYQEAHSIYPYLFPEDITNPADQLEHVLDLLDNVLVPEKILIPTDPTSEEYIDWRTEEIMADMVDLTLHGKEKPTFADRKEAEKKEAVARAKQEVRAREAEKRKEALDKLREQAKEHEQQALDKLREKREKQIQSLKDHYKEIQKNARERKIESADRTRLLNVARRLSKLKTYDVTKDYINSLIGDLDLVSKGITKRSLEDLVSLKAWYDDEVESNPDFIPDELTKKRLDRLSKTRISNMDIQDVRDLTDALLNIEHALSTSRKFHNKQIRIETYQAGLNTITDLENSGGVKNQSSKRYGAALSLLRPETLALKLVGYNRNSPLYQLTRELSKGENKRIAYQNEAEEMLRPFTSDKDFVKFINSERIEIGGLGENGNQKAVITPNLRMSLYMHSHNDANMRHIMNGGINVPDYRLLSKGKTAEAYARGTRIKLTPTQVRAITLGMTPKERAFADLCRNYYENVSKPALNEVSNDKLGYSIAKVDDYYRIPVNKNFLQTNFGELKKDGTVDGMGFLKERQEGATTPMDLVGLMETVNQDIRMHAKYVGLSIPVGDFNRLMSMMVMGYETSVMDTLEKMWGRPAHQYIDDLMSQLQGNGPKSSALDTVRSKYASAVLLGNVGVMVKQAASYPTAAAVLGWGPLTKAMGNIGKLSDHELTMMRKYSPMQIYREKGYGTIELGDIAARKGSVPKLLQGIQKVDILTTRKLFKACEYYVRSNMPELKYNSDEFWQAVGELHTRVIENTQPNYTTMQRPAILRSENQMTRALVMFKTQPMQNYNILYESLGEMIAKHRAYKNGGSEADYKQARRGFARGYTSIAVSTVVFAAMQLLWDMFRHKTEEYEDEGEMTIESVAKGLGIKSLASLAGMIPLGGEALTMLENRIDNILSEAGGEAFFNQTEYDLSAPTIDALNSLRTGIEALLDNSVKLSNWENMSGADREKVLRKIESALEGVGQFAGIPAANVRKLVTALIVNTITPISGKYMADYVQLRIEKAPAQNKNAYFDLLYEAYKNDRRTYDMLYEDMIGNEAFETSTKSAQDNVDKAIKDRIKADESKSEDETADDWQKVYDHVSQRKGWENLSVDQQAKVGQEIQKWAEDTGFNANYDKYLNGEAPDESLKDTTSGKIISGGEKKGVDAIGYFSYLSQLMEVDRPNGNGNLGSYDKNEIANALSKTGELSDTAKQYIWENKYPKSKLTYKEYIASEDYKKWKSNK